MRDRSLGALSFVASHQYAPLFIALFASLVWVLVLWWIVADLSPQTAWNRFHHLRGMEPNEIGDFLAGAFAPIAAIWLVATVILQFRANQATQANFAAEVLRDKATEEANAKRRETAARLQLPHILLSLSDYWEYCFKRWGVESPHIDEPPREALQALIELAGDVPEPTFTSIRKLVSGTQVFQSRMSTIAAQPHVGPKATWLLIMITDLMRLAWLTYRLFPYGRFEIEGVPDAKPTRDDLSQLYIQAELRDAGVMRLYQRYYEALPDS